MFAIIKERYRAQISNEVFRFSAIVSSLTFLASAFANYYAGTYATEAASNSVKDLILSNIPVYDVDGMFVYGSFFLMLFIIGLLLVHPKRIPFTLYSLALFTIIRSFFITLTHIAPDPAQVALNLGTFSSKFIFGADLFFSGHTGIPFLMALVFWKQPVLRYIFITWAVFFGTIALMGHLHYSIDVVAAFFITYSIFHIAEIFFKKERELFFRE